MLEVSAEFCQVLFEKQSTCLCIFISPLEIVASMVAIGVVFNREIQYLFHGIEDD